MSMPTCTEPVAPSITKSEGLTTDSQPQRQATLRPTNAVHHGVKCDADDGFAFVEAARGPVRAAHALMDMLIAAGNPVEGEDPDDVVWF